MIYTKDCTSDSIQIFTRKISITMEINKYNRDTNTSFRDFNRMSGYIFSTSTVGSRTVSHSGQRCVSSNTSILHCLHLLIIHPIAFNLHMNTIRSNLSKKSPLYGRVRKIIAEAEHQCAPI